MKKILLLIVPVSLFLLSCSKQEMVRPPQDESYWLRQERGIVVASDFNCSYYVVETARGYSILRSWGGGAPFPGDVLYGNMSNYGVSTFYNRSSGYLIEADVNDFWMTYFSAMDQVQWYCGDIYMRKADSTGISRDSITVKNK